MAWTKKILRVDLTKGTCKSEPLNMEWAERYIGGKGLLFRYMWEYVPKGVDPWSAERTMKAPPLTPPATMWLASGATIE